MDTLKKIYYDVKQGYIGPDALYRKAKKEDQSITRQDIKKFMDNQATAQMHKNIKINRNNYLPIFSATYNNFQIDLTFLPRYKKQNKNFWIILTCININNKRAYAYASKTKTDIHLMIEKFIDEAQPKTITSDNGSEFINSKVEKIFKDNEITHHTCEAGDKHKMGVVERFNRTLKDRVNKFLTANNSVVWVDILKSTVENYNNTYHSTIKMPPNEMTKDKEDKYIEKMKEKTRSILAQRPTIEEDDKVRVQVKKAQFSKGEPNYSSKVYEVEEVKPFGEIHLKGHKPIKYEEAQIVQGAEEVNDSQITKAKKKHKAKTKLNKEGLYETKQDKTFKKLQRLKRQLE